MTTVVPSVPELPPAPQRQMSSSTYPVVADTWAAAINPWTLKVNLLGIWMGQQVDGIAIAKQAAQQAAAAAADSADAANALKNAAAQSAIDATDNGEVQVGLAAEQVALAVTAKNESQAAALASGAAAGLPPERTPYSVLQINSVGNVGWGDGLIDRTPAVPGQALMLGTGKVPKWDFPGQQIGDVLLTCRDPGALYLPANGSIRSQSSYPALFAKLGLIGGAIGTAWADYDFGGATSSFIAASSRGTIIVWQSATQVRRSSDRGQTWANITTPALGNSASDIKTDGAGTWVILSASTSSPFQCLRSTDDGLTWQQLTLPATSSGAGGGWVKLLYCGNGTWIATANYSLTLLRSTNGGASWSTVTHGYPTGNMAASAANGSGIVLISAYDGSNYTVRKSTDYGATFFNFLTLTALPACISTDGQGTWIISLSGVNALRSFDDAATSAGFTSFTITGGVASNTDILFVSGLVLFIFSGVGSRVVVQNANGSFSAQSSAANISSKFAYAGNGVIFAGSITANRLSRSIPQFGYDTATQFALPNIQSAIGVNTYIKAKELA